MMAGKQDPAVFAATTSPGWTEHSPLPGCRITGCGYARAGHGLCYQHFQRWTRAGRPDQCRRDEAGSQLVPVRVHRFARDLAAAGASLLDRPEDYWASLSPRPGQAPAVLRAFTLDAYRRVEQLAFGSGWDLEYPRDRWRRQNPGITERGTILDFGKISQPWLRGLAKRWIRWRLSTGVSVSDTDSAVRVIQRFSAFLASPGMAADSLARVDRPLLERYLADLHHELGGRKEHTRHQRAQRLLSSDRQHGWDPALPGGAVFYPEDYLRQPEQLPRALADHVMAQLEQPGNLDWWDNPAYRLITLPAGGSRKITSSPSS